VSPRDRSARATARRLQRRLQRGRAAPRGAGAREEVTVKKLEAVIRPFKVDDVTAALAAVGVTGVTVSEVRGYGRQKGHVEIYRSAEYATEFVPKVKLEVAVPDELAGRALEALERAARSGRIGDGKVFVGALEGAVRIRTGERGGGAL
jgi:nitrogen regulatory protein PII